MAAALAAINSCLTATLSVPAGPLRDALNDQGFDSFDSLRNFSDQDVKDIAELIRRPGGQIPNPAFNAAAPVAGVPPFITNPGAQIGFGTVKLLRQFVHFARFFHAIQRPVAAASATLARLTALWQWKQSRDEASDTDPDVPAKMASVDAARRAVEDLDSHLPKKRGTDGAPLACVTRETEALPDAANDPGFDNMGIDEQLIRRSRLTGTVHQADNQEVWTLLHAVFHDTPGWNWISAHSRTRNGRAACRSMKAHHLGELHQERLRSNAEAVLESSFHDGASRNFTLEKLFERLNGAFVDLEASGEQVVEQRKVRLLLRAIEGAESLRAARACVMGDAALKGDFQGAVNYLSQHAADGTSLRSRAAGRNPRQVSAVSRAGRGNGNPAGRGGGRGGGQGQGRGRGRGRGGGGGRGRGGGRGGGRNNAQVTDRYCTPEEWNNLTPEQRDQVRQAGS